MGTLTHEEIKVAVAAARRWPAGHANDYLLNRTRDAKTAVVLLARGEARVEEG